jgi:preprotein translocase subunit YajC
VTSLAHIVLALAQATPPAGPCGGGGAMAQLLPLLLIFGVFYFLLIRPQQKREKQRQQMLSELKRGDEVVTTGGMIGRISGMTDSVITLEVQEKVRIRVLRSQVSGKTTTGGTPSEEKK